MRFNFAATRAIKKNQIQNNCPTEELIQFPGVEIPRFIKKDRVYEKMFVPGNILEFENEKWFRNQEAFPGETTHLLYTPEMERLFQDAMTQLYWRNVVKDTQYKRQFELRSFLKLEGNKGTGKSYNLCALAHRFRLMGYKVIYIQNAWELSENNKLLKQFLREIFATNRPMLERIAKFKVSQNYAQFVCSFWYRFFKLIDSAFEMYDGRLIMIIDQLEAMNYTVERLNLKLSLHVIGEFSLFRYVLPVICCSGHTDYGFIEEVPRREIHRIEQQSSYSDAQEGTVGALGGTRTGFADEYLKKYLLYFYPRFATEKIYKSLLYYTNGVPAEVNLLLSMVPNGTYKQCVDAYVSHTIKKNKKAWDLMYKEAEKEPMGVELMHREFLGDKYVLSFQHYSKDILYVKYARKYYAKYDTKLLSQFTRDLAFDYLCTKWYFSITFQDSSRFLMTHDGLSVRERDRLMERIVMGMIKIEVVKRKRLVMNVRKVYPCPFSGNRVFLDPLQKLSVKCHNIINSYHVEMPGLMVSKHEPFVTFPLSRATNGFDFFIVDSKRGNYAFLLCSGVVNEIIMAESMIKFIFDNPDYAKYTLVFIMNSFACRSQLCSKELLVSFKNCFVWEIDETTYSLYPMYTPYI